MTKEFFFVDSLCARMRTWISMATTESRVMQIAVAMKAREIHANVRLGLLLLQGSLWLPNPLKRSANDVKWSVVPQS